VKYSQLLKRSIFVSALLCSTSQPALANQVEEITNYSQLDQQAKFSTRAADLLAQESGATIEITAVRLNRTETELEVILQTADGKELQIDAALLHD
jgi:hypothetical protein